MRTSNHTFITATSSPRSIVRRSRSTVISQNTPKALTGPGAITAREMNDEAGRSSCRVEHSECNAPDDISDLVRVSTSCTDVEVITRKVIKNTVGGTTALICSLHRNRFNRNCTFIHDGVTTLPLSNECHREASCVSRYNAHYGKALPSQKFFKNFTTSRSDTSSCANCSNDPRDRSNDNGRVH